MSLWHVKMNIAYDHFMVLCISKARYEFCATYAVLGMQNETRALTESDERLRNVIGIRAMDGHIQCLRLCPWDCLFFSTNMIIKHFTYLGDSRHGHPLGSGQKSRTQHHCQATRK